MQHAHHDDAAIAPAEKERASLIMPLTALAEIVGSAPERVAELGAECLAQARAAAEDLEQSGQSRFLPLLAELEQTLAVLATPPGANACAAIAAAMGLLARSLKSGQPPTRSRELIAIAELRSVRGAPAPWCSPLIRYAADAPEATLSAAGAGADSDGRILRRVLALYRRSLLKFLRTDAPEEARRLSDLSRQVADAGGAESERRRWLAAASLFQCASEYSGTARNSVKRLAVKLEQALRNSSDGAAKDEAGGRALLVDLEVLAALLRSNSGAEAPEEESALTLNIDAEAMASALGSLADAPEHPRKLLSEIADGFLVEGKYDRWLEARRLAEHPLPGQTLEAVVARWKPSVPENGEMAPVSSAGSHVAQTGAAVGSMETAPAPGDVRSNAALEISGVPVDEALLENLKLMAREIRGARSRAEANLGSLKGGLVDMDRTIRELRLQLESLEVESQVHDGASGAVPGDEMPSKFCALSRGIEELAGLKDALQSLTEETESALAAQAGEDTQLEQGLLKTRMMPVGAQFEALCQCVRRAASRRGLPATLSARGAEVALERSQADALTRALAPLLESCVYEGLAAGIAPAEIGPSHGRIELEVSQPRFDVRVDVSYRGAPLARATLARTAPGLDALGAIVSSSRDGEGWARVSVLVPGPPQPMDLLRVEVGGNRFALPLEDVSGVSRSPEAGAAPGSHDGFLKVDDKFYQLAALADVLKLETADASGSACVLVHRGGSLRAFRVDRVVGRERTLVSSPGPLLASNPWVLGAVVDGRVAPTLVLDLGALEINATSAVG